MKDAPDIGILLHNGQAVQMRLTVVDDDRQTTASSHAHLCAEDFLLTAALARVFAPVIIQTDLTDGLDLRMLGHLLDLFETVRDLLIGHALNIFRVITDCRVHERIALGVGNRLAAGFRVTAGIEDQLHAVSRHGREQRVAILVKPAIVIMCVCIKYL